MKYCLIYSILLFFLWTCNPTVKQESDKTDYLLKLLKTDITTKSLSEKLDSLQYNADSVYKICQNIRNDTFKMKLVSAVFHTVENYMQENNQEYWAAILYDLERFAQYVQLLKTSEHQTFLDVGSANGEKLFASLCLGFEKAYGIEYSPELVKISQKFFKNISDKTEITLHDALTIEGAYYQKPDFIYMYSPIRNPQKMAKLYHKIMQNMKEKTILIEVRMVYMQALKELTSINFPEITGHFIIKKQNDKFYYLRYGQGKQIWNELKRMY